MSQPSSNDEMAHSCILIIMGPPGSGKGTQARAIARHLGVKHIDCGQLVRMRVADGTGFGQKAKKYVLAGHLVPDDLIIRIMLRRIKEADCENGFLLDGFPRTLVQAKGLESFLDARGGKLNYIINLGVSEETAINRLSSRRSCPVCGAVYNILSAPPKVEGTCDVCGADIERRHDDEPETVVNRLRIYKELTLPLREFYSSSECYFEYDGNKPGADVTEEILNTIKERECCD